MYLVLLKIGCTTYFFFNCDVCLICRHVKEISQHTILEARHTFCPNSPIFFHLFQGGNCLTFYLLCGKQKPLRKSVYSEKIHFDPKMGRKVLLKLLRKSVYSEKIHFDPKMGRKYFLLKPLRKSVLSEKIHFDPKIGRKYFLLKPLRKSVYSVKIHFDPKMGRTFLLKPLRKSVYSEKIHLDPKMGRKYFLFRVDAFSSCTI